MNTQQIQKQVQKLVKQQKVLGVSWGTIEGEMRSQYYEGVMGCVPPVNKRKLTGGQIYDLASLTKAMGTATRMLQLIDNKQITFSTKIADILPAYQFLTCTIEDLLLHRGGLPADLVDKTKVTKSTIRQYLMTYSIPPNQITMYSDLGYFLLGEVISTLGKCSLAVDYQQHLFQPMKMKRTGYQVYDKEMAVPTEITRKRGMIQGIVHDSKAYQLKEPIGSAGLFSSLTDVLTFADCLLNNQFPNGRPLFSKAMYTRLCATNVENRTLGWERKQTSHKEPYLYHTGFTGTSIGLHLEKKEALILLSNRIHPNREDLGFLETRATIYNEYF